MSGAINSGNSRVIFPNGRICKIGNKMGGVANELEGGTSDVEICNP